MYAYKISIVLVLMILVCSSIIFWLWKTSKNGNRIGISHKLIAGGIVLIFLLINSVVAPIFFKFPIIGKIRGAENEIMDIGETTYKREMIHEYSVADKGRYIGAVSSGDIKMRVFEVKGVKNQEVLYVLWDWEGSFYTRQDE